MSKDSAMRAAGKAEEVALPGRSAESRGTTPTLGRGARQGDGGKGTVQRVTRGSRGTHAAGLGGFLTNLRWEGKGEMRWGIFLR